MMWHLLAEGGDALLGLPPWAQLTLTVGGIIAAALMKPTYDYLKDRAIAKAGLDQAAIARGDKIADARINDLQQQITEGKQERAEVKAELIQIMARHRECEENHQETLKRLVSVEDSVLVVQRHVDECEEDRKQLAAKLALLSK